MHSKTGPKLRFTLTLLLAAVTGIHAQQTPQQIAEARQAMAAGVAAAHAGDLAAARREFARSVELAPGIAESHAALGSVLLLLGEYNAAVSALSSAHKLAPADANISINLADAEASLGRYTDAVPLFREAATGPKPALFAAQDSILFATALSATNDDAGAEQTLRIALTEDPGSAELHDAIGTVLAKRSSMNDALNEFEQAVTLSPGLLKARFHQGVTLLTLDRPAEAIPVLRLVALAQPADFESQLQLGRALSAMHQDAPALVALHEAAKLTSAGTPPDALYSLALALQASGDAASSLPFFVVANRAGIRSSAALTNHALALVQTGDAKGALPLYQQAVALGPDEPTLREDFGVAYLQQSDLDHALEQFRAGLKLDPQNAHLHYDLGLALKLKDDLTAAVPEFERAAELDPALPDPAYTLGVIYMQQGRFADAVTQLKRATVLQPGNGDAWALLGSVLRESGEPQAAVDALKRALVLEPDQPSLHVQLATLELQAGDKEAAAVDRRIAADLSKAAASRQRASFALKSGRSLLADGKLSEAITQLKVAAQAEPAMAEPHRLLADAYNRQGDAADAALERKTAETLGAAEHP